MRRDFRLYELSDDEFESLVVRICVEWLGQGVSPFAPGKDGGRDGKYHGTAACYPSASEPLKGHVVLQAKHVNAPDKSCSDREFETLLKAEEPKIKRLIAEGICDHYLVFTNRKLTGGADEKLVKRLLALGLQTAAIIGIERLGIALETYPAIRQSLPNLLDETPFHLNPDDLVEVIGALHTYADDGSSSAFDSALDFEKLKHTEKNKINGVSADYYQQIIVDRSMPHFARIDQFLKNPRNAELAALYYDSADELKEKILLHRSKFETFDHVFGFLIGKIQKQSAALKSKRRLVSIIVHYMYCNCDIGSKQVGVTEAVANADA